MLTLLPLLRLEGMYFALATLGLNFVFFDLFHNLAPRVEGTEGLYGIKFADGCSRAPAAQFATILRHHSAASCWPSLHIIRAPSGARCERRGTGRMRCSRSARIRTTYQIVVWGVGGGVDRAGRRALCRDAFLYRSDAVHA